MKASIKFRVFCYSSLLFLIKIGSSTSEAPNALKDGDSFDFIVVGGGLAGCVVASRLAENGKHTVLLMEEGGIPNPNLEVPALSNFNTIYQNFPNDLKYYQSVPQRNAGLAGNGIIQYGIGKVIGGGSSVNALFWNRGHPNVYNAWAKITKDDSWSYYGLMKYFQKSEKYVGFNPTEQRGYKGPITVSSPTYVPPSINLFLQAGQEIGYPYGDPNGPQIPSVAMVDFSQDKNGRRVSAFSGYIQPLLKSGSKFSSGRRSEAKQSNLLIILNTVAKRVTFEGNKAVGVKFASNNSSKTGYVTAKKEIIVTAGVMDSPALLMRSGIGPGDVLSNANVPVVKHLPVGRNLQDHVAHTLPIIYGNRSAVVIPSRDLTPSTWKLYQETGDGPYSSVSGAGAQGFFLSSLESSYSQKKSQYSWPDIQIVPYGIEGSSFQDKMKSHEVALNWGLFLCKPKSRGTVTLNMTNIYGPPMIDFQSLSHPDDIQILLEAIKFAEKLCERTSAMKSIGCRFPATPFPACSHLKFRSDPYWTCYIKQISSSAVHAAGTCRMGSGPKDMDAVVDPQLKVIGIDGLRVADASIAPIVSNANTQSLVYGIAEKAADLILKTWEEPTNKRSNIQSNNYNSNAQARNGANNFINSLDRLLKLVPIPKYNYKLY